MTNNTPARMAATVAVLAVVFTIWLLAVQSDVATEAAYAEYQNCHVAHVTCPEVTR